MLLNQVNIAPQLGEEKLKKIADDVISDVEADIESAQSWLEKNETWLRLYFQEDNRVNPPWADASNDSVPLLTESCNQFQARTYKAFFPTRLFVSAIPTLQADEQTLERAERVAKHMSYQLSVKNKSYKKNKNALFLGVSLHGSYFTKTYYDPIKGLCIENISPDCFIVPYGVGQREIEDLPRKTHVMYKTLHFTQSMAKIKYFTKPAEIMKDISSAGLTREASDEVQGFSLINAERAGVCKLYEQHRYLDLDNDGVEEPYVVTVDATSRQVLRVCVNYYMDMEGNPTDEYGKPSDTFKEVQYFTHYMFLPNPNGFYGLGFGHLLAKINSAINRMLRSSLDAAELANTGNMSGFVTDDVSIRGGPLSLSMGEFQKVGYGGDDIRRAFYQPNFKGPDPSLVALLQAIDERGQRLASVTDALTGDLTSVQQPTTVLTALEQSLQLMTSVQEFLASSLERELQLIYNLNSYFLEETPETFSMQTESGMSTFAISSADYSPDLAVMPIFDPKAGTENQKIQRAQTEYQTLLSNPLTANDPQAIYNVTKRFLKAINAINIDEILPPPPPPPEPLREDDPVRENMIFLSPDPVTPEVFPDQDHLAHIRDHETLMRNEKYYGTLDKERKVQFEDHIQSHIAMQYGEDNGAFNQVRQDGTGGMGEPADNAELLALLESEISAQQPGAGLDDVGGAVQG